MAVLLSLCAPTFSEERPSGEHDSDERETRTARRAEYSSSHFRLYTDLSPRKARRLLGRLENTLDTASAYWGRSPRGSINCYVAQDAANWPAQTLPHPLAKVIIQEVGGVTFISKSSNHQKVQRRATVCASARPGVAEHESMHAYCYQTFGATGPAWYKEGMAELACHAFSPAVQCSAEQIEYLQTQRPPHLEAMFDHVFVADKFTQPIFDALFQSQSKASQTTNHGPHGNAEKVNPWSDAQRQAIQTARRRYYYTWALCHLLYHHPRYNAQFQSLGRSFVRQEKADFEDVFSKDKQRITFEFNFFLQRIESGYRVDLCAWPWQDDALTTENDKPLADLKDHSAPVQVSLIAARGFQATPLKTIRGRKYGYTACGFWSTRGGGSAVDADGGRQARGRLTGVIMKDYQLSSEFHLGVRGEFTSPADGQLFLRCRDDWGKLHDNRGGMTVRLIDRSSL